MYYDGVQVVLKMTDKATALSNGFGRGVAHELKLDRRPKCYKNAKGYVLMFAEIQKI